MVALDNGCLCCVANSDDTGATGAMDAMLDRLADPSVGIDVIVIEASGLAEPQSMIRLLLASADPRITYGGLLEVVDAAEYDATRARHPELDRHVRAADLVVLNKTDRVDDATRVRLLDTIAGISPGTPVVTADHGRVDPGLLFDREPRAAVQDGVQQLSFGDLYEDDEHDEHSRHLHALYDSAEFSCEQPLAPRAFMDFLDSRPAGLYRMKGVVRFAPDADQRKYTLHAVGGYLRFQPAPWERTDDRVTQLVMIGSGIDAESLTKQLHHCVEPDPAGAADEQLIPVLRYVRDE
jgi:G3E family GTPase